MQNYIFILIIIIIIFLFINDEQVSKYKIPLFITIVYFLYNGYNLFIILLFLVTYILSDEQRRDFLQKYFQHQQPQLKEEPDEPDEPDEPEEEEPKEDILEDLEKYIENI